MRYGVPLPGYVATSPASLLVPGHYDVDILIAGRHAVTHFEITADGGVR